MTRPITIRDEVAGGFVKRLKGPDPLAFLMERGGFLRRPSLLTGGPYHSFFVSSCCSLSFPVLHSEMVLGSVWTLFWRNNLLAGPFTSDRADRLEYGLVS